MIFVKGQDRGGVFLKASNIHKLQCVKNSLSCVVLPRQPAAEFHIFIGSQSAGGYCFYNIQKSVNEPATLPQEPSGYSKPQSQVASCGPQEISCSGLNHHPCKTPPIHLTDFEPQQEQQAQPMPHDQPIN